MVLARSLACLIALTTTGAAWQALSAVGLGHDDSVAGKRLKLVAEFKHNQLEDISSDGKLVVLYQTGAPVRNFTLPAPRDTANHIINCQLQLRKNEGSGLRFVRFRFDSPGCGVCAPPWEQTLTSDLAEGATTDSNKQYRSGND